MEITVYPKLVSKEDFKKWEQGMKVWSYIDSKLINKEEYLKRKEIEKEFDETDYMTYEEFFKENEYDENNYFYEHLITPKGEEVVVFAKIDIDTLF